MRWMPFEFPGNPSGPDPGGDKIYIERIIQRIRLTRRILQRFVSADSFPGSGREVAGKWPGGGREVAGRSRREWLRHRLGWFASSGARAVMKTILYIESPDLRQSPAYCGPLSSRPWELVDICFGRIKLISEGIKWINCWKETVELPHSSHLPEVSVVEKSTNAVSGNKWCRRETGKSMNR